MNASRITGIQCRWMATLVLALGVGLVPCAQAADQIQAIETVDVLDLADMTLSLGGKQYRATPTTRIQGLNGEHFSLSDLRARNGKNYPRPHRIEFTASRSGTESEWVLLSITVLGLDLSE